MDEFKLSKLEKLKKLGVNPYPYSFTQGNTALEIKENYSSFEGKKVSIAGRITRIREMGKLCFLNIIDSSSDLQILSRDDNISNMSKEIMGLIDIGDIMGIVGVVTKTKKGEISVDAKEITMLSKSLAIFPEKFHGLTDTEQRYRKRYLDLIMNPDVRNVFMTRTKIVNLIREFLNGRGFMEVETPVLQPVYGGANAKPFKTHHNYLDEDLYLRIANELYLKRLIIGGFEKVYEFSKDFRNEDVDSTHNPEFTQVEIYEAYKDYSDFADMVEKIIMKISNGVAGGSIIRYQGKELDLSKFKRINFVDAIKEKSGIDVSKIKDDSEARQIADSEKLETPAKNRYHVADSMFDKYVKPDLWGPTLVMDYPSYMCPLVKDKRGNPDLSERFEIFIAGLEVGNCYSELTDPIEQRKKFEEQNEERKKGDEEMPPVDIDFLEAIEYGMPPTAGIGISIDRLTMIFTDNTSIKETILFPTVKTGQKGA